MVALPSSCTGEMKSKSKVCAIILQCRALPGPSVPHARLPNLSARVIVQLLSTSRFLLIYNCPVTS
ncbi:uncharacterized protein K460DRAFT_362273 [Cucurbitaria berberidis CBS 394.84]|uniref:Uncharacterized protein n=1 Tax=Cucurbitaria berberidis CBS 394.84 TaxID=1168544 RepID=A0A9P4LE01_9PLEO|nr:uncharacterized protein K460DRAFT_362273 [Cucurbitaria berberidis CBS 394.84]KAF1851525.1 hypothetical protein K460DRAFT_362273 [Cucurbitaria berberidis CBS 394.84]